MAESRTENLSVQKKIYTQFEKFTHCSSDLFRVLKEAQLNCGNITNNVGIFSERLNFLNLGRSKYSRDVSENVENPATAITITTFHLGKTMSSCAVVFVCVHVLFIIVHRRESSNNNNNSSCFRKERDEQG